MKSKKTKLKQILLELSLLRGKMKHIDSRWEVRCCTCVVYTHRTKLQWWHFQPQSKGDSTRFEIDNINAQCQGCNGRGRQGEQYKHWLYIDKIYWDGRADELTTQSCKVKKWGMQELEDAIDYRVDLIANLYNKLNKKQQTIAMQYFLKKHRVSKLRILLDKIKYDQ